MRVGGPPPRGRPDRSRTHRCLGFKDAGTRQGTHGAQGLSRTSKIVSRAFDDVLSAAGASLPTWLVLVSLKGQRPGPRRAGGGDRGGGSNLTHHLNRMESAGLVTRWRTPANRSRPPRGANHDEQGDVPASARDRGRVRPPLSRARAHGERGHRAARSPRTPAGERISRPAAVAPLKLVELLARHVMPAADL